MVSAEHFEDGIDAFAARKVFDGFLVIFALVIYAVLKSEAFDAGELFVGRGGSVHLDAEQFANLNGGGAHASSNGVDEDAVAEACGGRPGQFRLPRSQVRRGGNKRGGG